MAIVKKKKGSTSKKSNIRKEAKRNIEVKLPKEKSKPLSSIGDYSILLYGFKKIGKTDLASQFPDALFFFWEPGGKAISVYQVEMPDWETFLSYIDYLEKNPSSASRYKTIVNDTVDQMYDRALEYVCRKRHIEHPGDEGFGKGWKFVKNEINQAINRLQRLGMGLIYISHAKTEEIDTRSGRSYSRINLSCSKQMADILDALADIWIYYDYIEGDRYLWIKGDEEISAGTRLKGRFINPKTGGQREKIYAGNSSEQTYKNLLSAFSNKPLPYLPNRKGKVKITKKK